MSAIDQETRIMRIPLTRGLFALVDWGDYEWLMAMGRWHADTDHKTSYALGDIYIPQPSGPPRRQRIRMHRVILGLGAGGDIETDHIDRNGLNNTRANLRRATRAQNEANKKKPPGATSQYKGVHWSSTGLAWDARISECGRRRHLGSFHNERDAALAYDAAAREIYGEFACLNFPGEVNHEFR